MNFRRKCFGLILVLALIWSVSAQAVLITGAFTGAWFDDAAPGQGFIVQVVEVEGSANVVVFWFTFDAAGNQVWLFGQAPVSGDSVTMELLLVEGGILDAAGFDPSAVMLVSWGSLTLSFEDCDHGTASYSGAAGSGELAISRLTESMGDDCTGTVVDNVPAGGPAVNIRSDFVNTGLQPAAKGKVKYEQNANFVKLKVHAMKLDPGTYELQVDGQMVGLLVPNNGGNAKLFFRGPDACNWAPLDFDPLDRAIDVVGEDGIVLTTVLDSSALENGSGDDLNDSGDDDEPDDSLADDSPSCSGG